jgi:hypothetical protein
MSEERVRIMEIVITRLHQRANDIPIDIIDEGLLPCGWRGMSWLVYNGWRTGARPPGKLFVL